ncbi:EamA family transporter [Nocardia thailandica]
MSSATLSAVDGALTSSALVAGAGGLTLLGFGGLARQRPLRVFAESPWLYVRLGALEAANLVLFVGALAIGPLPVVVALHLMAPLLLLAREIVRRRRQPSALVFVEFVLVGAAIALAGAGEPEVGGATQAVLGCVLAIGSAVCVATLVSSIARESAQRATLSSAGWQLVCAGVAGSVLIFAQPPSFPTAGVLVGVGALLLGPGFALYWLGLRGLDATAAGVLGLNEAVFAAIAGALFTGTRITPAAIVAGALVLAAVVLEQRSRRIPVVGGAALMPVGDR